MTLLSARVIDAIPSNTAAASTNLMTRCIETSRNMQQAYPEFGDATPDSRGSVLRSVRQTSVFTRIVDVGIRSRRLTCVVRSELRLVPSSNHDLAAISPHLCLIAILVVTTLERNVTGRCRTNNPPTGAPFAPCGYLPAWGFFHCRTSYPAQVFCPTANLKCLFSYTT